MFYYVCHHLSRETLVLFVPADDRYWVFREADVLPGYPQPIHEYGQGVPTHNIDTAIWWEPNGHTYFFSGDRYITDTCHCPFKVSC